MKKRNCCLVIAKLIISMSAFILYHSGIYASDTLTDQQISFYGAGTNLTYNIEFTVNISMTISSDNSVSGYLNATGLPGGSVICGAGNFTGMKDGNSIEFTFVSNDPDPGCGFDHGLVNFFHTNLIDNGSVLSGNYDIDNGQKGVIRVTATNTGWIDLKPLFQDYQSKEALGKTEAAYAHFYWCIADSACKEYTNNGSHGWAGGFIKHLFDYQATHNQGSKGSDINCGSDWSDWDYSKLMCVIKASEYHFVKELYPGFASYCGRATSQEDHIIWDYDHDLFLLQATAPCFDVAFSDYPAWVRGWMKFLTVSQAVAVREFVQSECPPTNISSVAQLRLINDGLPVHPAPLPKESLFYSDIVTNTSLSVEITNTFFISVGVQYQLAVTKRNSDGSITDLTSSTTGTEYVIVEEPNIATITQAGMLSVVSTPHPFINDRPLLYVFVRNANDFGIGQFAIVDVDSDNDLIADSYELNVGLNPSSPNLMTTDTDRDLAPDRIELMVQTNPKVSDTDHDKFRDEFEIITNSDPLNPQCTPIAGCQKYVYLPLIQANR